MHRSASWQFLGWRNAQRAPNYNCVSCVPIRSGLQRKKIVLNAWKDRLRLLVLSCVFLQLPMQLAVQTIPSVAAIDAEVSKVMARTHANGMAIAVIDHGKVIYVQSYGIR